MAFDDLTFAAPSSDDARHLNALIETHDQLLARVRDIERERDDAGRAAQDASNAVAQLEHRRARGEDIDAATMRKAEATLNKARERAHEAWGEKIAGVNQAIRDARNDVQRFAAEAFDALAAELGDEAEAVTARVNAALAEVVNAYHAREHVAARTHALVAAARGRSDPNLVPYSRVDRLAQLSEALAMDGGERAPVLRRAPTRPESEEVVA